MGSDLFIIFPNVNRTHIEGSSSIYVDGRKYLQYQFI
jgi:hypothetical protein